MSILFFQSLMNGLMLASLYSLIAAGVTLIFGVLHIIIVKFINNCTFLILCVKLSGVFVSLVSTSLNADSGSARQDVVLNVLHQDVFSGQEFFLQSRV